MWQRLILSLVVATVAAACNSGKGGLDSIAQREMVKCPRYPTPGAVPPPPGVYINQGITLDYDKLVPESDPFRNVDVAYFEAMRTNPLRVEQVYYDAAHGNVRASWLICYAEAGIGSVGRNAARHLASLQCQTIYNCDVDFDKLPYSPTTASGIRIREIIGRAFQAEAARLRIQQELISHALTLLMGAKIVSTLGVPPGGYVSKPLQSPKPRSLGAHAADSGLSWSWRSKKAFGHTFTLHGAGMKNMRNLRGRAASTQRPQGQWLDNEAAADFLQAQRPYLQGPVTVVLPSYVPAHVIMPDGTIRSAVRATLIPVPAGGYRTAFPVL